MRIATPLFKLLTKDTEFLWDDHCQHAFEVLKEKITQEPILRGEIGIYHSTFQ
jgi:hypothetical protein